MEIALTNDTNTEGYMSALRKENGHGYEIVPPIPKPDGKLIDTRGDTIQPAPQPTLMARLNEKSKDEFTVTKGMAGIIVILLTAAGLFLGYIIPGVRESGKETERLGGLETKVEQMSQKLDDMQKSLIEQRVKDAEARGYKLGQGDGQSGHK